MTFMHSIFEASSKFQTDANATKIKSKNAFSGVETPALIERRVRLSGMQSAAVGSPQREDRSSEGVEECNYEIPEVFSPLHTIWTNPCQSRCAFTYHLLPLSIRTMIKVPQI
ncbi:hypothetical protein CC2G_000120 [Coprinopsis cinerea AmutBmut pab1-1]|nr:hypothetical protein CC2G_000120 [Coprinopsis cinerea AmutBmut pab1-1]